MRKLILFLSIIFTVATAIAQVKFGIKAGYNLTNLTYSTAPYSIGSYSAKSNFNAGMLLSIPLFKSFYLQPEIVYSAQGADYTFQPSSTYGYHEVYNYNYLTAPFVFKFQHRKGFFAETGPQLGILLNPRAYDISIDERPYNEKWDFSWLFGLGYKIPRWNLGIDARYNLGLTSVNINHSVASIRNSVFQTGIFFLFGKKQSERK